MASFSPNPCGKLLDMSQWHRTAVRPGWLDWVLLIILIAAPFACLAQDADHNGYLAALLPLLSGIVMAGFRRPGVFRLISAILLAWGFLAYLDHMAAFVRLAAIAFSPQVLFLILLLVVLSCQALQRRPAPPALAASGLVLVLTLLFHLPAASISGALTLQTPLVFVFAIIFIFCLEPLGRLLGSPVARWLIIAYALFLVAFSGVHWMIRS